MSVSSPIQRDSCVCLKHTHTDTRVLFGGTLVCARDCSVCVKSYPESDFSVCVKHTHTDIRVLFGGTLVCVVSVSSPIRKGFYILFPRSSDCKCVLQCVAVCGSAL